MLDKDTKTTIQNARDVLVGKVPNPVSQIDLITTAMIYKFMDDMDLENIEFGGKRVFFTDDLEPYAWSKLMNPKLGHYDRISLYAEALDKLQVAKQIPDLFRRIFKGAFLPFRDGATLTLFLNEINQLKYDNSENLGDAFEFLLSVMGSQGDAGQFRTPRHIIDFIVDVVNPLKTDSILDPACGTAGFLISAYKHIINQAEQEGKLLSPEEMKTLTNNINGYDISPDMVKLASVNLFLHQFKQPHIYEYDTLSSDVRWDEKFDVILANPPFMTPKGGIMPHSRFGVKSNRSEVLFVDYFMEHLNINGKAGFVVPEGIIFQSANAYKSLRKMMVEENYLYAVVSLPSGVFNPYAGVKTSILFFDKTLAKKTDKILFVKIDNDGFDLGAQRRPIKENDIPKAIEALKAYQNSIEQNTEFDTAKYGKCLLVSKDKIRENGEYNLTASRYEETKDYTNCQYEMVKLGDICEILDSKRKPVSKADRKFGIYPYYGATGIVDYIDNYIFDERCVLIGEDGAKWGSNEQSAFIAEGKYWVNNHCHIIKVNKEKIVDSFLVEILNQMDLNPFISGCVVPKLTQKDLKNIEIPLPPLEVQEEIVKELDQYQAIIDGAQKVVDNWKPTFTINPNWEKVKLGDEKYFGIESGGTPDTKNEEYWNGDIYWVTLVDLPAKDFITKLNKTERTITDKGLACSSAKILPINSILVSSRATIGRIAINQIPVATNQGFKNIIIKDFNKAIPEFVAQAIATIVPTMNNVASGGTFKEISKTAVAQLSIPLPPLEEQKAIVAQIEQEEQYVDACKKLIEINQQKITNKINSIWNNED